MVAEEFKKEIHEDIREFNKKIIEANMECTKYCKELKKRNGNKTQRSHQVKAERIKEHRLLRDYVRHIMGWLA